MTAAAPTLRASLDALLTAHEGAELALVVVREGDEATVEIAFGPSTDVGAPLVAVRALLVDFAPRDGMCECETCTVLAALARTLAEAAPALSAPGGRVH